MRYSEDPELKADGHPDAKSPRDRCPGVSEAAKKFLAEAESLEEELFDLADLFRVPVTNNIPWFDDGDADKPIYEVGEFIAMVKDAFIRRGWTPPEK